jgi:hypothetical protein
MVFLAVFRRNAAVMTRGASSMPFPRAFYRTVTQLSRSRSQTGIEVDLADLDFDRPDQAFEALRRMVAEAGRGEQLVPAPKSPPHLRHLEYGIEHALAVYSRH